MCIEGEHIRNDAVSVICRQRNCEINHNSRSMSYSLITVSVIKIVIWLLTDAICMFLKGEEGVKNGREREVRRREGGKREGRRREGKGVTCFMTLVTC